ncbi:MAG: hypothetical protein ABSB35_35900 [Bryobacteraceae bacterium]|jgi:hypothetical protein
MKTKPFIPPALLLLLPFCEALAADSSSFEPLPPDLPLPASLPMEAKWLREANVLQPYGHSEFAMLADAGNRPQRVRKEFGFNAITVQPPDSHNTVAEAQDRLTEEQFRSGVAAYRAAGYRLLLYTSVMACGLSPEFQSGQVAREHPDWLQRDPKGNPVMVYGVPWLCPNTGARDVALDRALRIAREYQADGILLDNNEFFFAQAGWTCHCAGCTRTFRDYVRRRCGVERARRLFGARPDELEIPHEEGPLYALWLQWRNRVWAEINETFRARLRQVNPQILLFANTQYAYDDAMLGTDFQYQREDIVVSESVGLNSRQMSEKMVLGHAVASGRPLWNYIGTFVKGDDYTGLKPAAVISPLIAATLAHAARPWIVDGFDLGPTDANARDEMSRLLGWHAAHEEFFTNEAWAGVGMAFSLNSRNVLHRPLIPPHLSALQSAGTPAIGLRDDEISAKSLRPFRMVTLETAGCLNYDAARALAKWVRRGGRLIAARDAGSFDELGRKRLKSSLWQALALEAPPDREISVGRGTVIAPEPGAFAQTAVRLAQPVSFCVPPGSGVEVISYRTAKSLLLHLVRHVPTNQPLTLQLPDIFHPADAPVQMFVPGSNEAQTLTLLSGAGGNSLSLTNTPTYAVLKISLRDL